jgi:hypothetical protein
MRQRTTHAILLASPAEVARVRAWLDSDEGQAALARAIADGVKASVALQQAMRLTRDEMREPFTISAAVYQ